MQVHRHTLTPVMQAARTQVAGRGAPPAPIARWTLVLLASVIGAFATAGCATGGRSASGNWKPVKELSFEITPENGWKKVLDKNHTDDHISRQYHMILYSRGDTAETVEGLMFYKKAVTGDNSPDFVRSLVHGEVDASLVAGDWADSTEAVLDQDLDMYWGRIKDDEVKWRWAVFRYLKNNDLVVGVRYVSAPSSEKPAGFDEVIQQFKDLELK